MNINRELYPFESHYFDSKHGKMHYIDEGEGEVILFVHGTPAWSFLYGNQIKQLSENYRCIAIDHIGFGLSEKPKDFSYHPKELSKCLEELVDELQLNKITLAVHDFGGPIGLSYAIRKPQKIKRIILFNTWLWSTENNKDVKKIDKVINTFVGRFLYLNFNFSAKYLLKNAFHDKSKLSKEAKKHYTMVFPSKEERYGPFKIAKQLKGASDFYKKMWGFIKIIEDTPILIIWGMEDSFIKPEFLTKWQRVLNNSTALKLNSGHFPQEEKSDEVNESIMNFMDREYK